MTNTSTKSSSRFSTGSRLSAVDTPQFSRMSNVSSSSGNFMQDDEGPPSGSGSGSRTRASPPGKMPVRYNLSAYDDEFESDEERQTYDDEEVVSDASPAPVKRDYKREQKQKKREKKEKEKREKRAREKAAKVAKAKSEAARKKEEAARAREAMINDSEAGNVASQPLRKVDHLGPNMNYIPITDVSDADDLDESVEYNEEQPRRSKRRRFEPMQFWKNERLVSKVTGADNLHQMEIVSVVAQLEAVATPMPTKDGRASKKGKGKGKTAASEGKEFDVSDLSYPVETSKESTVVWDELTQTNKARKVVVRADSLNPSELPITHKRDDDNERVGSAAQAFNIPPSSDTMPGWISGNLALPPLAIKDAEGVGDCTQVFFVQTCQPGSFEVSINDPDEDSYVADTAKRFVLRSGDFFHVPPNNIYRIQNHSEKVEARLFWVIIKSSEELEN